MLGRKTIQSIFRILFTVVGFAHPVALCSGGVSLAWRVEFEDGTSATNGTDDVSVEIERRKVSADCVDITGRVFTRRKVVTRLEFPEIFHLDPAEIVRVVMPEGAMDGLGVAFDGAYFGVHAPDNPTGWRQVAYRGSDGFRKLTGKKYVCASREIPLQMLSHAIGRGEFRYMNRDFSRGKDTREARKLIGDGITQAIAVSNICRKQVSCWLPTASFAWAGGIGLRTEEVEHTVRLAAKKTGSGYGIVTTFAGLCRLLESESVGVIVSPLGCRCCVERVDGYDDLIEDIARFIARGGVWIECGDIPFNSVCIPCAYGEYACEYPTAFADFTYFELRSGANLSVTGVQRREGGPWKARSRFVPSSFGVRGGESGVSYSHGWKLWVRPGERFQTPIIRLTRGKDLGGACDEYMIANGLTRKHSEKLPPDVGKGLLVRPFLKVAGRASQIGRMIDRFPGRAIVHVAYSYLRGGNDNGYPDHLPPRPSFGTAAEFRDLVDKLHGDGHYFCPYTNPTWWSDNPKGPTFLAAGEGPLGRNRRGELIKEDWESVTGYRTCLWHPAVRAANGRTVSAFLKDYPSDILFRDQVGARGFSYDFNPAAPDPISYSEGMISMAEEESALVPYATEGGWDRIANAATACFGMTFATIPTGLLGDIYPLFKVTHNASECSIEPIALRMAHANTLFYPHNLGQWVFDPCTFVWTLALGFSNSCNSWPGMLEAEDAMRLDWYRWVCEFQRRVTSRILLQPVSCFTHDRRARGRPGRNLSEWTDDGVIVADYGPMHVVANLGDVPRQVEGICLAPWGYDVRGAGVAAYWHDGGLPTIEDREGVTRFTGRLPPVER